MIYIILPAYNEGTGLAELLAKIKGIKDEYQVVLVNDGSNDQTAEIARIFAKDLPLKIITHEKNRGLGQALKSGVEYVLPRLGNTDVLVTLDADNTHPPELIPQMAEKIRQGNQIVIASRFYQGGKVIGLNLLRRFLSRGACSLFNLLFPYQGIRDYTSGYRAYSGNLITQAHNFYGENFITEKGFTVMAEILIKLKKLRPAVIEIPLLLRYDLKKSKSKIKIISTVMRYFVLFIKNL